MNFKITIELSKHAVKSNMSLLPAQINSASLYHIETGAWVFLITSPNPELDLDANEDGAVVYSPYGECLPMVVTATAENPEWQRELTACRVMDTDIVDSGDENPMTAATKYFLCKVMLNENGWTKAEEDRLMASCRKFILSCGWMETKSVGSWNTETVTK
jgi:hypothetical protein